MTHENLVKSIEENLAAINTKIDRLIEDFNIKRPTIIGITKNKSTEFILAALDAGIMDIGENFSQEMITKHDKLQDENITWHFVGHLQRRNAKAISTFCDYIHGIDSESILNRLRTIKYKGEVFLQYNISQEGSKSGIITTDEIWSIYKHSKSVGLAAIGIMVIPDPKWDDNLLFEKYTVARNLASEIIGPNFSLSAGMTNDWDIAVIAGSTHIRIGTALFGPR